MVKNILFLILGIFILCVGGFVFGISGAFDYNTAKVVKASGIGIEICGIGFIFKSIWRVIKAIFHAIFGNNSPPVSG